MRIPLHVVSLSLALLSACGGDHAPTPVPVVQAGAPVSAAQLADIDSYVQAQMASQHIPGLSLVVSMQGIPVLEKGYGTANIASGTQVKPGTVFQIGSITKQFTATAIMLLVQDGRIRLDDKVSQYLPTAPASWSAITIRHLLQHTSGLQRDLPESLIGQLGSAPLPGIDSLITLAAQFPLENPTGAVHSYSNVGYHVLGFVIEKVTGQYFADFLRQRVFVPLDMTSADVIQTTKPAPMMATGYLWNSERYQPASGIFLTPGLVGAGGNLQMSAPDLAKWDAALLTERILTKASLAQMWTPAKLNNSATVPYGFGWVLGEVNHRPYTWHSGALEGFTSAFERHTEQGLSVIVLDNLNAAAASRISARVAAIVKPELAWVTTTDPHPATGVLLRSLIDEVRRGALVPDERFTPEVRAALVPEVVAAFVDFFKPWGPIEQFGYIDQSSVNGVSMARYLVRAKNEEVVVGIRLDASGKVASLVSLSE